MTDTERPTGGGDYPFGKLPDHVVMEIFLRVPVSHWGQASSVNKHWANFFKDECLWKAVLHRTFPLAAQANKRWPGPIPPGLCKRRYAALFVNKHIFSLNDDANDEVVGHAYLFLREQLQISRMPLSSGILHGTIIDQFIACGKSQDAAYELASLIWLAVIDNLEETEQTFWLLKRLAMEEDVFLSYPYTRCYKVQWRIFERLFTDFRDCLQKQSNCDYYDLLVVAKNKFQVIPAVWLGF